jgi:natural product precursor
MKKLSKLKLNALNEQSLEKKNMNTLRGGVCITCQCSCYWQNSPGGSSIASNRSANAQHGYSSVQGYNQYTTMRCW